MGLISRVSSRTYRFKTCARLPTVKRQSLATSLKFSTQPTKMKYVAAYMFAALSGDAPDKAAVKKVLESVGAEINAEQLDKVFSELDGKDVNDFVAEGMGLLASVPSGGAAPAAAAAGGDAAPAAAKEEEKKEESEEESDSDMGFDLFG